jgi:TolB-like protein
MKKSNLFLLGMLTVVLVFGTTVTGCSLAAGVVASEASHSIAESRGIKRASDTISAKLVKTLPEGAGIAVLSIESRDPQEASYVISELEYAFVNSRKFQIASRSSIDAVMREQNFQLSGNVSDADAVSIGRMSGATIVITGNVNRTSTTNTLAVRAIDVQTAQILFMERETFR